MTAPAGIKQADLNRMATVARDKGVCVEIEIDGKIVRVFPSIPEIHKPSSIAYAGIIDL